MKTISKILSTLFSPLLVPTYGVIIAFWCSILAGAPVGIRVRLTLVCFAITCLVPLMAILALWRLRVINDPGLNERRERTLPYLVTALSYGACSWALSNANAPDWVWLFPLGGMIAVVVSVIVNFKWKISAHLAGMGGLVALVFRMASEHVVAAGVDFLPVVAGCVFAAGAVGTARVFLGRHTLLQVIAGTANGFLCVYLTMLAGS